jgi:three-Cys-motif partner protein
VTDDNLPLPEVGEYARHKYALLYGYARMFSTSMKNAWPSRVYVDLFSAAGMARIKQTGDVVRTSSLIALSVPDPFTKYIFCEEDERLIDALRTRVEREHPGIDSVFLNGDANELVDEVLNHLTSGETTGRPLSFCFVDPSGMNDLRFPTIASLAAQKIDFLCLIPTGMDFNRFKADYFASSSLTVQQFSGVEDWRRRFEKAERDGTRPERFLLELFDSQMRSLGYEHGGADCAVPIRLPQTNRILYYLAFYSGHPLGRKFFREAAKYSLPQQELF